MINGEVNNNFSLRIIEIYYRPKTFIDALFLFLFFLHSYNIVIYFSVISVRKCNYHSAGVRDYKIYMKRKFKRLEK